MSEFIFKEDDKVKVPWSDEVQTVVATGTDSIMVNSIGMYNTGKLKKFHVKPIITLVKRPRKMVTKTIERWVNIYDTGPNMVVHESKKWADNHAMSSRIACVKLTGTYEVEE